MYLIICGVIFVLLLFLFLLGYWRQTRSEFARKLDQFPGPPIVPIFGNVLEWSSKPEQFFVILRKYSATYKGTYRLWPGILGSVNVNNPKDAEAIMKHIKKSLAYSFVECWLGTGLLTSSGKKWQKRRKILTPAFHFNILQNFVDVFGDHCEKLVEELKKESNNLMTDVVPIITRSTLNIICETAMGTKLNNLGTEDQEYVDALCGMTNLFVYRVQSPWYYLDCIYNLSWTAWKQRRYLKILHSFTTNVIKEREKSFVASDMENFDKDGWFMPKKRLAMLDLLIDYKRKTGNIDDEGIREEVDTFMFEGHDTTSMGLSFALMLLANHKDAQEKIFNECQDILGDSSCEKRPSYDELQKLEYTGRFIKESLRLYPSVPFISRVLSEDLKLSNGVAPAGCIANIHIYDLHRNPDVFPNPEQFDPDRFLPENSSKRHPYSHLAFSAGPRNCIGQKFAMMELKSIISAIVRHFILEPVDTPDNMFPRTDIVLRNNYPIYVKFILRK